MVTDTLHKMGYTEANDPWDAVTIFERELAEYAGSKYAVCIDSCSNALFLCMKYLGIKDQTIEIPAHTYSSVPCQIVHAGNKIKFSDIEWDGHYQLGDTPIVDAATQMYKGMYKQDTFMCVSFHHRKILKLGRGGVILTNDADFVEWAGPMIYDGRHKYTPYAEDELCAIGYHMYMTPEDAVKGLELLHNLADSNANTGGNTGYRDLRQFDVFKPHYG